MSDYSSISNSGAARKFSWMPTLDGYIMRAFLVPFFILLFAFTLLFIIMDMYNDVGDFLDKKASVSVSVEYFLLKIPGNIRFILPITVLLACMYALANLGRSRELTAIRASGVSLARCGMPIFAVGFCVMLVNFYFNEQLVPETTRQAEIVKKTVDNEKYVEQSNAQLQFHSGDRLRSWYFGQFDDDGYQEKVKLKIFEKNPDNPRRRTLLRTIEAEKTRFVPGVGWEFYKPEIHEYSEDGLPGDAITPHSDPLVFTEEQIPDKPSVIVKSVIEPDALSSLEIVSILRENVAAMEAFACVKHAPEEYKEALNTLFRPLLLDGISMLELLKENDLAEVFRHLQGELMGFMRSNRTGCLSDVLDIQKLKSAALQYEKLIVQAMQEEKS